MPDLISREALLEYIRSEEGAEKLKHSTVEAITLIGIIKSMPAVDAVPIKPLCVWLAGYAAPPAYTIGGMPYKHEDAARRRAEGWEQHIHTLIECGLLDEGEQNA